MLNVVAPLDAEGDTANGIAAKETASDAHAPLVSCAFILKPSSLLSFILTMRAFKEHGLSLPKEARNSYELPLLLS